MPEEKNKEKIAVVLVRGLVKTRHSVRDTLKMLRLCHPNHCVVLGPSPPILGMLRKAKDFITWGEIDEKTFQELVEKHGQPYLGRETCSKGKLHYQKFFVYQNKKYQKSFRLNPPRKGFGRKGIKIPFKVGGALGYRGKKINDLIRRML